MDHNDRKKTVTWQDPKTNKRDIANTSGLDYLKAIQNKAMAPPPVAMLIGYKITHIEKGYVEYEMTPAECHYNPFSSVHGGILSTLLDTAMTASVLSTLPKGANCSTVEIKINFVRPVTSGCGALKCVAKPYHLGRSLATAEGRLIDRNGKLYAHGTSTCSIFRANAKD
jgi:uncharacterized protein (TIGR00369 family)